MFFRWAYITMKLCMSSTLTLSLSLTPSLPQPFSPSSHFSQVTPGGRAAKAGLVAGDYVLSINGKLTAGLRHLEAKQLVVNASDIVELLW